jgi:hypothetical protein
MLITISVLTTREANLDGWEVGAGITLLLEQDEHIVA